MEALAAGAPRRTQSPKWRGPRDWRSLAAMALLACLMAPFGARAHGGLSMDDDKCKLRVGPYFMHFAGYQPLANGNREFCEDIPQVGPTVVVMDMTDEALRSMPVEVRIIRDTGDESRLDAVTVLHLPPRLYPSGSVPLEHNFQQPGRFVGLVMAGEKGQYVSRFPFSVGEPRSSYGSYLLMLAVPFAGLLLYLASGRARRAAAERARHTADS